MIERDFIAQKTKEYYIMNYIETKLKGAEVSDIKLKKIPLGEKIIVTTSRPSLVVGSKGANIRSLTTYLKKHFKLENPQIEIVEVKNHFLDAAVVAKRIAFSLERFGSARFKGIGHKMMDNVVKAGALGVEIKISGKIPGARAKNWRFYQGYLKKCGDVSMNGVKTSYASALLKTGIIGIQVRIMPPDVILPDSVKVLDEPVQVIESKDIEEDDKKSKKKKVTKKKAIKKKTTKKKVVKKEEAPVEKTIESKDSEPAQEQKKESKPKVEAKPEVKEEATKVEEEKPVIEEKKKEEVNEEVTEAEKKPVEEVAKVEEKVAEPVVEEAKEEPNNIVEKKNQE
jgi:small subunit ribosomal protein S3